MATLFARGSQMLARNMKAANTDAGVPRTITITRRPTSYAVTGWIGRGLKFNDAETGLRVEVSEREFFFKLADLVTAGLTEPRKGDRFQVSGETTTWEILDPSQLNEPAWRYSDSERTIVRIHTKLVKVA